MLNYVILITHSSHFYSMWDFTHTCNPTVLTKFSQGKEYYKKIGRPAGSVAIFFMVLLELVSLAWLLPWPTTWSMKSMILNWQWLGTTQTQTQTFPFFPQISQLGLLIVFQFCVFWFQVREQFLFCVFWFQLRVFFYNNNFFFKLLDFFVIFIFIF